MRTGGRGRSAGCPGPGFPRGWCERGGRQGAAEARGGPGLWVRRPSPPLARGKEEAVRVPTSLESRPARASPSAGAFGRGGKGAAGEGLRRGPARRGLDPEGRAPSLPLSHCHAPKGEGRPRAPRPGMAWPHDLPRGEGPTGPAGKAQGTGVGSPQFPLSSTPAPQQGTRTTACLGASGLSLPESGVSHERRPLVSPSLVSWFVVFNDVLNYF